MLPVVGVAAGSWRLRLEECLIGLAGSLSVGVVAEAALYTHRSRHR